MKRVLAPLIVVHRYLGLAFCLIFLIWFASGIVMVFKRMPEYSRQERLDRLPVLDPSTVRLTPARAFDAAGLDGDPDRVVLTSFGGRPVYRVVVGLWSLAISAEDGSVVDTVDSEGAVAIARGLFAREAGAPTYAGALTQPDQWTIGNRFNSTGALHRVSLGDAAGTDVYIAEATGEVVMKTDRSSRFWGYAGPVLHWFYFTPLRAARGPLWNDLIVWGSVAGCVVCILGLVIGIYRVSIRRRYFHGTALSPYDGWLRWHHYAGLLFGVITLTWTFSGLLTMSPWNMFPGGGPTREQVVAIRGAGVSLAGYALPPAEAIAVLQSRSQPKELELTSFMGTPFYAAYDGPRRLLVAAGTGPPGVRAAITRDELVAAATAAMSGRQPTEIAWLTEYDAYYYDRIDVADVAPLPVLRAKFDDPEQTWLYLNANDGSIVSAEVSGSRTERWLYQAFHSLDFPGLYDIPWLWYVVIVALSLGGVALSATSVIVGWRYLAGVFRPQIRRADALASASDRAR